MPDATSFREIRWQSFDRLTLYARQYGEASHKLPVICLPGLTRNARDFEDVAPWIAAQDRQVFAVDLRGRGNSAWDGNPRRYNVRVYARDIALLLKTIGAPRAIFVGTSLGGRVTMILALRHPRLVGGAVLNDIGPHIGRIGLLRIASYAGKQTPVRTWADAALYTQQANEHAFPTYHEKDWQAFARRLFREDGRGLPILNYDPRIFRRWTALDAWLNEWLEWRAFKALSRRAEVLLTRGALSQLLEPATVDRMVRIAPSLRVVQVAGVGHAPMLTEPDARAALSEFLARQP